MSLRRRRIPAGRSRLLSVVSGVKWKKTECYNMAMPFNRSDGSVPGSSQGLDYLQGVSKKRGPFLKMLYLLHLWRKLFQIFCGCSKLIPLCTNDVFSGVVAYRK